MPDSERQGIGLVVKDTVGADEIINEGIAVWRDSPNFFIFQRLAERGFKLVAVQSGDACTILPVSKDDRELIRSIQYDIHLRDDFIRLCDAFEGALVVDKSLREVFPKDILPGFIKYGLERAGFPEISGQIEAAEWTDEDVERMVGNMVDEVIERRRLELPSSLEPSSD